MKGKGGRAKAAGLRRNQGIGIKATETKAGARTHASAPRPASAATPHLVVYAPYGPHAADVAVGVAPVQLVPGKEGGGAAGGGSVAA